MYCIKYKQRSEKIKFCNENIRIMAQDELEDIFIFMSYLCHDLNVDIERAVIAKLKINESKYPIDKFKGSNKKYNSK